MSSVVITGDTSGSVTLSAPAVAGTTTLTLPTANGTIITTGSTGQVIPKAALPTGSVLQVVQATKTDTFSTTSGSYTDITGLSVSITPTSSSSKVFVMYSFNTSQASSVDGNYFVLVRNSTQIFKNTAGTSRDLTNYFSNYNFANSPMGTFQYNAVCMYLDSPATTSATTYKIQMSVSGSTGWINRRADGNFDGTVSSITVMEIAA